MADYGLLGGQAANDVRFLGAAYAYHGELRQARLASHGCRIETEVQKLAIASQD